jgi:hypothetical protein
MSSSLFNSAIQNLLLSISESSVLFLCRSMHGFSPRFELNQFFGFNRPQFNETQVKGSFKRCQAWILLP